VNIVFSSDPAQSTKFPAVRLAVIRFGHMTHGVIWTPPRMDAVTTERVFCVCAKTRDGRDCLRVYPLESKPSPTPPTALASEDHPWSLLPTTHVLLHFGPYVVMRPLELVERAAAEAILMCDPSAPHRVRTFVRHVVAVNLVAREEMREIAHLLDVIERCETATIRNEINTIVFRYVSDLVHMRLGTTAQDRPLRLKTSRDLSDVAESPVRPPVMRRPRSLD
jgi:hypothetical protein